MDRSIFHPTGLNAGHMFHPSQEEMRILSGVTKERVPQALPLVYHPSMKLATVCTEELTRVTEEIEWFVKDMLFTMLTYNGIGLAAPQVGQLIRLFVVDIEWTRGIEHANPLIFINPVVTPAASNPEDALTVEGKEGCLSFPGAHVRVNRFSTVHVKALGLDGQPFEMTATGLLARVIQHEYDHLNGVTIAPHLSPAQRNLLRKGLKRAKDAPKVPVTPQR